MSFKLDTASLGRVRAHLKGKGKEFERKLSIVIDDGVADIHKGAVERFNAKAHRDEFPTEFRSYQNRIQPKFYSGIPVADVVVQSEIMAYLEFGTGKYAKEYLSGKSSEIRQLARTFFKTGKGTLREFSYLIPSFEENRSKIINKLRSIQI